MSALDEFIVVNRRRKSNRLPKAVHRLNLDGKKEFHRSNDPEIDLEKIKRGISNAVKTVEASRYRNILLRGLEKALEFVGASELVDVVCYGLGNFSQSRASKFQLAVVLIIKSHYRCQIHVYDPLFFKSELEILRDLDLTIIDDNEEAKRTVENKTSLIYMPHCPYQLTNNFLHANWTLENLSNCLILSNSFGELVDSVYSKYHEESTNYIARINPYTTEIELENNFEYEEVFNATSIHIFLRKKLLEISKEYWTRRESPVYKLENCDFIQRRTIFADET